MSFFAYLFCCYSTLVLSNEISFIKIPLTVAVLQSYSTAVITVLLHKKLQGVKMVPSGILSESKFRAFEC